MKCVVILKGVANGKLKLIKIMVLNNYSFCFVNIVFLLSNVQLVGQALVTTLQDALGEDFTADVQEAYVAFYAFVTKVMQEGPLDYKAEKLGECVQLIIKLASSRLCITNYDCPHTFHHMLYE